MEKKNPPSGDGFRDKVGLRGKTCWGGLKRWIVRGNERSQTETVNERKGKMGKRG